LETEWWTEGSDNKGSFLVKMQWGGEDYKCWVEPADPDGTEELLTQSMLFRDPAGREDLWDSDGENCERRRDDANKDEVVGIIDVGGRE
jgi:hypothetical protein